MPDFKSIVIASVEVLGQLFDVKRHFMYLCCFNTNVNALYNENARLYALTLDLLILVNTASNNAEAIHPRVESWLSDSNNLKEEADIILNEVSKLYGSLRVGTRYNLSKRAKMTMEDMIKMHLQYELMDHVRHLRFQIAYEFYAHKRIERDIMITLRVNKKKILGICGMGGIGKTTMAKRIINKLLKENVFQEMVIVAVSQRVDEVKIQVRIGDALGLGYLEMETPQNRAQKLHDRLTSGTNRTLLVLDDVWESLRLKKLGIPCEGDSQGCTILITSRNSDVLREMGVENIFNMELLSEKDAWFFFTNTVGACVNDISLRAIAERIVKKCIGLPLALVAIGEALRDETSRLVWENALEQLSDPNNENAQNFYMPIKISYDALESELVKLVLLLCGLFPEGIDIRLEYLTYFCMGLRIFKDINLEEATGKMSAVIKILKTRSLLLDGEEEDCVRMHDVVRDACIFIAKQEGYIDGQDCTWMLSCSRWTEPGLGFSNLKLLYLISDSVVGRKFEMDDSFFQEMRDLNVLSIENSSWTSLPHTTQLLKNIQTLLLISCPNLETVSVIGDLVNLEILICRDCGSIQEFILEIKSFNRLKLLELSGCQQLQSIGVGVISGTDLEEICDIDVSEIPTELILKSLPALKHLQSSSSTSNMNVVSILNQLSCIYIYGCHELCNLFSLSAMTASGSCLLQLERLVIESCGMMEQVFLWNEEERNIDITLVFPKLKFLSLISLPMLTSFCKGNESFEFPLLATMRITCCPLLVLGNLVLDDESRDDHEDDGGDDSTHLYSKPDKKKIELWINQHFVKVTNLSVEGNVYRDLDLQQEQSMRQLRSKECWRGIKSVNLAVIAPVFPLLEVLQLVNLAEVEKMEFDDTMPSNSLQNLREIRLQSLQALKHLWQSSSSSPSQINQLSSIYIYGCNGLSNLFSLSMTATGSCLLQLEKLEIESCEMMEQVFLWNEESEKQRGIHVGEFPKLKFLRLSFLPRLTDFCRGIKRIECPLLTEVKIVNCPKLRRSVYINGNHSLIFNSSKSVQHQRAKDTNSATAMQLRRPGKEEKGKRRLEDSSNEIEEL